MKRIQLQKYKFVHVWPALLAISFLTSIPMNGENIVNLAESEKALAAQLGYSEEVLLELKKILHPEMALVKYGGLEEPEGDFVDRDITDPHLKEDREQYSKIAAAYPELKEIVDIATRMDTPQPKFIPTLRESERPDFAELSEAELGQIRNQRFSEASWKYSALEREEALERIKDYKNENAKVIATGWEEKMGPHGIPVGAPQSYLSQFKSEKAVDDAIAAMDKKWAGKTLKPENRSTPMLGLRYFSNEVSRTPKDSRIPDLRDRLFQRGYRISENKGIDRVMQFKTTAEARAFLQIEGLKIKEHTIEEQKPRKMEVIFPINWKDDLKNPADAKIILAQNPWLGSSDPKDFEKTVESLKHRTEQANGIADYMNTFVLYPGADIKKTGPRRWLMDVPERCIANVGMNTALVFKAEPGPGYELVKLKGTMVPPELFTDQIIEKLKDFDRQYGITVLDATGSSITLRFKNVPADAKPLCREIRSFCPQMFEHRFRSSTYKLATDDSVSEALHKLKEIFINWSPE